MNREDCQLKLPHKVIAKMGNRDYVIIEANLLGNEIRNECWNCNRYYKVDDPKYYQELEEGQKVYIACNHCGMVNHI